MRKIPKSNVCYVQLKIPLLGSRILGRLKGIKRDNEVLRKQEDGVLSPRGYKERKREYFRRCAFF